MPLAAVEFTARENAVTGTVSDGSPTVLITVTGDDTLVGCQREYLTAVTYSGTPGPGVTGTFTQPVRYYPGKNTIKAKSSTGDESRTTTFTIAPPNLRVVLEWAGNDLDYDLYVNDVNWTNKKTPEGELDKDAFAGRSPGSTDKGSEVIVFRSAKPGRYNIYVNYYSDHDNKSSNATTVTVYLGNEVIYTQTDLLTEHEAHGASLAGPGKSVWNVGTVIVHGDKAGGYAVVDDDWSAAKVGWRDLFRGDNGKPMASFEGQLAVDPRTDFSVTALKGPSGTAPVTIGKRTSASFGALGKVNTGSSNEETRALIGRFKSSDTTVAVVDDLGVVTGVGVGKSFINFGDDYTKIEVRVVDLSVVVDRSGDHKLEISNNETSAKDPFRFWLNGNRDVPKVNNPDPVFGDIDEQGEEKVTSSNQDSADDIITCRRDVGDFAPLRIVLSRKDLLADAQAAVVEARWGAGTIGTPSIQLFRSSDDAGKLGYMTDYKGLSLKQTMEASGDPRHAKAVASVAGNTWKRIGTIGELKPLVAGSETDQVIPLIFEGVAPGEGWFEVQVRTTAGAVLGLKRVYMHLSKLADWYAYYSCVPDTADYRKGRGAKPTASTTERLAASWVRGATRDHTVLFVHGYNMEPYEKTIFAESAFKRMWWNGYRGRFIQFDWPATYGMTAQLGDPMFSLNAPSWNGYATSEMYAFYSSDRLAALVNTLVQNPATGTLHITAHSQGNIVVANALKQLPASASVATYVALQAAVASELHGDPGAVMATPIWLKGLSAATDLPLIIDPDWDLDWSSFVGFLYPFADWVLAEAGTGLKTPNLAQGFLATGRGLGAAAKRVNFYNPNDWALGEYNWEWGNLSRPSLRMAAENRPDEIYFYKRQINPPTGPTPPTPFGAPDRDVDPGKRIGRMGRYYRNGIEGVGVNEILTKSWSLTPVSWLDGTAGLMREDNAWFTVGLDKWRKQKSDERGGSDGGLHKTYNVFDILSPTESNQTLRQYEIVANVIEGRRRAQGRSQMTAAFFSENIDIRTECWNGFADASADPDPAGRNGTDGMNPGFIHHRWHSGQFSGTIMEQSRFWRKVLESMGTGTASRLDVKPLSGGIP